MSYGQSEFYDLVHATTERSEQLSRLLKSVGAINFDTSIVELTTYLDGFEGICSFDKIGVKIDLGTGLYCTSFLVKDDVEVPRSQVEHEDEKSFVSRIIEAVESDKPARGEKRKRNTESENEVKRNKNK